MKKQNITAAIIGFGNIGRSITNQLLREQSVSFSITVIDPNENVYGSFLDMAHAAQIKKTHNIHWNDTDMVKYADFIFHCAGPHIPIHASRLSVASKSIEITKSIFKDFKTNTSPYIIVVSNPVDVISYYVKHYTGLPQNHVIGTGTLLDTARLNFYIQSKLKSPQDVDPLLLGEHGESIVFISSHSYVDHTPLHTVLSSEQIENCITEMKKAATEIKKTQGATYYGASSCAVTIMYSLLKSEKTIRPLSIQLPEELQQEFECPPLFMSLPTSISEKGIFYKKLTFSNEEKKELKKSALLLSTYI